MAGRHVSAGRAPGAFDAFVLARRGAEIAGTLDASSLPRMGDRLAEGKAPIRWRIAGSTDDAGRPALEIAVDGTVPLECQSCLRTFQSPVAQRTRVLLARDERELARLDETDEHEVIVGTAAQDARTLIEDELLLTLPFAPHCRREDCARRTAAMGAPPHQAAEPESPFAVLAGLKARRRAKPRR
jgi:uncharacterized protein